MEERTGWRGQNESQIVGEKKNGRLVGAAETSKERAEWRRLQRKNLSIQGLPKRKEWPQYQREQLARTPEPPLPSWNTAVCPKYQIMREERLKVGRGGIRVRAWSGKGGLHREGRQIPRKKGRASKKSLPRRGRRKHERVSGRKSSPGRSEESRFHS